MKPTRITDRMLATIGLMRASQQRVVRIERDNVLSRTDILRALRMAPGHPVWEATQSIVTDAWIEAVSDAADGKLIGNPQELAFCQGRVSAISELKAVLAAHLSDARKEKEESR